MEPIRIQSGKTLMIAHRGLSGIEKENTLPAFVAAGNRSYFGIETDVHRTSDGKYVIIHDDRTGRVAPEDLPVEESPFSVLRELELYDTDRKESRADLRIPTLSEYIRVCKRYEKKCVLELKNQFTREEIREILNLISEEGWLDQVIFISFFFDNLVFLRELKPEHPVQFLFDKPTEKILERLILNRMDVDVHYAALTPEWLERFHRAGLKVNCWTVDNPAEAEKLIGWGVDFITSNILE